MDKRFAVVFLLVCAVVCDLSTFFDSNSGRGGARWEHTHGDSHWNVAGSVGRGKPSGSVGVDLPIGDNGARFKGGAAFGNGKPQYRFEVQIPF